MSEPTARELLLDWRGANFMDRRAVEGQLRARAMPIRLPTEEAIVYALIDWLEDVEKRLAKQKRKSAAKRAKPRPKQADAMIASPAFPRQFNGEAA